MPSLHLRWAVPMLLAFAHPVATAAQVTVNTLRPGDEVRVHAPAVRSTRLRGTVVLYQGATLEVRELSSGTVVSIPIESIHALARNQGVHRGRSSWRMALLGGFLGGASGLVAGPLIATSRAPDVFGEVMVASALGGTLGGAGLGAMLGAAFARDQWQRFRMPIVPTLSASTSTVGVSFTATLP